LFRRYLGLLGESDIQRPSEAYREIYTYIMSGLKIIQDDAAKAAAQEQILERRIASLNESQTRYLANIDAQIASLNSAMERELKNVQDRFSEDINKFKAKMAEHYQWIKDTGMAEYGAKMEKLRQQLIELTGSESEANRILNNIAGEQLIQALKQTRWLESINYNIDRFANLLKGSMEGHAAGWARYDKQAIVRIAENEPESILTDSQLRQIASGGGSARSGGDINLTVNINGFQGSGDSKKDAQKFGAELARVLSRPGPAREAVMKYSRR
jgi:hypothetical protein